MINEHINNCTCEECEMLRANVSVSGYVKLAAMDVQKEVMGEPLHDIDHKSADSDGKCKCLCGKWWIKCYEKKNLRDFSTPTDYCALEDRMRELGEWGSFTLWLNRKRDGRTELYNWQNDYDRTQRAALIAEYWRQR